MRTKIYLFILIQLFIITNPCFSQGNWELMLPTYPTSNQLVSLDFIDEHTGLAVGEYGTIVKTTDGGESWKFIEIPWLNYLLDVDFVNNQVCYAVGQNGQIIQSTDGGENWEKQSIIYTNNLHRVRFCDETNGWIIGEKGLILHTSDGGSNWQQQISGTGEELRGIALIADSSLCVVGTKSTLLLSTNRGYHWEQVNLNMEEPIGKFDLNDVFFLDDKTGWIGLVNDLVFVDSKSGKIIKTTDGGKSWNEVKIESYKHICGSYDNGQGCLSDGIQQIYFKNLHNGLCLLDVAKFNQYVSYTIGSVPLFTEDDGKNWNGIMHGWWEFSNQTGRFCFLNNNKVINTGYGGEFRFSYDSGQTWDYPNDFERIFMSMIFGNNGKILACKIAADDSRNIVYMSSEDYGKTWQNFIPQVCDSTGQKLDIQLRVSFPGNFINDREILWTIHNSSKQSFKSEDFGLTWHCVKTGLSSNLNEYQFLSPDTLIRYRLLKTGNTPENYASELKFYYSFDGGQTVTNERFPGLWNDATPFSGELWPGETMTDKFIYDSYFFNGHFGFLVGSDGNIVKTTDTGRSWKSIYSGVVDNLYDIEFIDDSTGFVVGSFGRILKTEDRGETWRKTDSGTQETILSVGFKNENEGWVGTEKGLRYTIDGGETWKGAPMRYQHGMVRHIEFDDYENGYAYSYAYCPQLSEKYILKEIDKIITEGYVLLLCMKNDGAFVEDENGNDIIPRFLELHHNYPNPFNAITNIMYNLPETESVTLKVYNIQGQLVRVLVDETQKSGEHTVLWDGLMDNGVEVTSGVYFYRLECGKEVKTIKMVLLK
jgi:photosystem II stability/assembly factor-like uncharacterized protein